MPFYRINLGLRLDDVTCARLLSDGISLEVFTQVVRVLRIAKTSTNTIFTIDAGSETIAENWRDAILEDITDIEEIDIEAAPGDEGAPPELDVWAKVGQWTKSVGNATTTISSLPDIPKGVILWGSGLINAAFGTYNEAGGTVLGYADGTLNRSFGFACEDNQSPTNANRSIQSKAFHLVDPTGDVTGHIKEGCTVDFNATSFDMDWDATTNATVGHYFVFGGDDIEDVQIKDFEYGTTDSIVQEYTGLGRRYDFGLFLTPYIAGPLPWGNFGITGAAMHSISAMAGTNRQRSWTTTIRNQDNVNPSSAHRLQKRTKMLSTMDTVTNTEQQYCTFVEWTDDGYKLDWVNPPSAATGFFSGFFVKGGKWDAGYFYQPPVIGTIRSLLLGKYDLIQGIMGFSINQSDVTFNTAGSTTAKLSIGGEDADGSRGTITYAGNTAKASSEEATIMLDDTFIRAIDGTATASSSTVTGECTVSDMATRGEFTCDYTITDGISRQVVWFTLSA